MKIVSSSSNLKYDFSNQKEIAIYVCGPTVYNHIHIGNVRPIVTFDVLHRYLKWKGVKVNFIHNITDIDDKIIKAAKEENINELEFSNYYTQQYIEILKKLNILSEIKMPKVSENINEIISFIDALLKNKNAYLLDDGVYFDVSTISDYGTVSGMDINKLELGKRIDKKENKKNFNDFVLWKNKTEGITWDSPFGNGRPGWHTECVVLINKYVKDTVDIHGGGIDLRFPHHENENAQFEAIYKKPLARVWMHVGHLMMNNEKMSKSIGNFIIVKDVLNEWTSNSLRWFFYQVSYQKPINFSFENLHVADKEINKIFYELNKAKSYLILNNSLDEKLISDTNITRCFENDLDFPNIITAIQEKAKLISTLIKTRAWNELNDIRNTILWTIDILGIVYQDPFNEDIIKKLKDWYTLLTEKKYEQADQLRKVLSEKKVI